MNEQPPVADKLAYDVQAKPSQKRYAYKTKLKFIDIQRPHEFVTSVEPPAITQAGIMQFLLDDRLVGFPLSVIFRWETEQLDEIMPAKLIVRAYCK